MDDRKHQDEADRQTRSLAGLAFTLALAIAALIIIHHLKRVGDLQDCLLAGRSNCDALLNR